MMVMVKMMSVILTTAVVRQACWDASSISAVLVRPGYFAMMFSKQVTAVLCCAVLCCAVLCCAVLCCAVLCCAVLEPDVLHVCANPKVQWYPSIILVKRSPNAGYLVLCQYTGTFVSSTMLFQMQHDLGTAGCPYPDGFS